MNGNASGLGRLVDKMGQKLFWGVYCLTAGWAAAIWFNAIPPDSAGVKLLAAVLAPAVGAGLALLGALKVMRETGRRETRRAMHQLLAATEAVRDSMNDLIVAGDDRKTMTHFVLGRDILISQFDIEEGALPAADSPSGAHLYREIKLGMKALELLLEGLGARDDIQYFDDRDCRRMVGDIEKLLALLPGRIERVKALIETVG